MYDFDFIMEAECYAHEVSQKLKITLFETLQSRKYEIKILRIYCSSKTNILQGELKTEPKLSFTTLIFKIQIRQNSLTQIIPFGSSWQPQSSRFVKNFETFLAVQGSYETITITQIPLKHEKIKKVEKVKINLKEKDKALWISNFINMKFCSLGIAYTKRGKFYLIIIKNSGGFQLAKLDNLQDIPLTKSFFPWLASQPQSFSHINMQVFRVDKYQRFIQLVVIRDCHITLHLIQLRLECQKSSITLLKQFNLEEYFLKDQIKIHQSIITEQGEQQNIKINLYIACARQKSIKIIKIKVDYFDRQIFNETKLIENIKQTQFSFIVFNQEIVYRTFNTNLSRYEVFRNKICWLQNKDKYQLCDENPFISLETCPYFKANHFNLYIVSIQNLFSIPKEEEDSDFSPEQKKWLNFKDTLNTIYQKKIQKINNKTYQNLISILHHKQESIILWMNQQRPNLVQEDIHVKQILEMQIVCIKTVTYLCQWFLVENVESMKDQFFQAAVNSEPSSIQRLIMSILDKRFLGSFFDVLSKLKHFKENYRDSIKVIFQEPLQRLSQQFQNSELQQEIFLRVVQELAYYQIVKKKHLNLFNIEHSQQTLKRIIISNKMDKQFIHFFLSSELEFTSIELNLLIHSLKQQSTVKMKKFLCDLLTRIKKVKVSQKLIIFIEILTESLLTIHDEVSYEIDRIMPGLNLLILAKRGKRDRILDFLSINPVFQEYESKQCLYMLIEDILQQKRKVDDHIELLTEVLFGDSNTKTHEQSQKDVKHKRKRQLSEITEFQRYPSKRIKDE